VPRNVPVARQAHLLAVLAVTGAAPLTVGVILWVIGTVMHAGYHGGWAATAGTGQVLIMAGLLCGLCMFVLAANSVRWMPHGPAGRARRVLQSLDSPEQQAWLADRPQPEAGPVPPGPVPPGPEPADPVPPDPGAPAPGEFPADRPWPEPGPAPAWPAYPDQPGADQPYLAPPGHPGPPGADQPYLAPPGPPGPGGNQRR
jgi:hypothetical protein